MPPPCHTIAAHLCAPARAPLPHWACPDSRARHCRTGLARILAASAGVADVAALSNDGKRMRYAHCPPSSTLASSKLLPTPPSERLMML
ncbi:hypothetical protein, partial [Xanthomonas fragariae]|uniref:hypothetical protein n=1 Tax=Xanthomonas fragariae TaxID=48664 RepID=UPI001F298BE9